VTVVQFRRPIAVAEGRTVKSHKIRNGAVDWLAFVRRLTTPIRTPESFAAYLAASREEQDRAKDVGHFVLGTYTGGVRKAANLKDRSALSLDLDHAPPGWAFDVDLALGSTEWVVYSTHKHRPEAPRLRLLIPLTRPVTPDEYEAVARRVAARIDTSLRWFDRTTFQAGRVMHYPSCSRDGAYEYRHNKGAWLDPDAVLAQYADWRDLAQWPRHPDDQRVPHAKAQRVADPCGKTGWLGAWCRAYDIDTAITEHLPDVYRPGDSGRYTYAQGTTSNGVVIYEGKFAFSHHEHDPAFGRLCNAFDIVRIHRFGTLDTDPTKPVQQQPSYKQMLDYAAQDPKTRTEMAQGLARTELAPPEPSDDWRTRLQYERSGAVVKSLTNVLMILRNDPIWGNCVSYNRFSGSLDLTRALPHRPSGSFADADVTHFKLHLETVYGLSVQDPLIRDAVTIVSRERACHPVLEFLDSLPDWDGVPRVETMLRDHLGTPLSPYSRAVARKVLCAAINRVKHPGCKFDHILILEGGQGRGKSRWIEALAQGWFASDLRGDLNDKAAIENMRGKWIIEIQELDGIANKKDVDAIKHFVSRPVDRMRVPYGTLSEDFPRQCIFIGSTNRGQYMVDDTGNRRYWPIACNKPRIDIEKFREELPQIWAEALVYWLAGEPLWLDDQTAEQQAKQEQSLRQVESGTPGLIEDWLTGRKDIMATCVEDVWENLFQRPLASLTPIWRADIRAALGKIPGWKVARVRVEGYGTQLGIVRLRKRRGPRAAPPAASPAAPDPLADSPERW
jgi:predicted P-loop ATPase